MGLEKIREIKIATPPKNKKTANVEYLETLESF